MNLREVSVELENNVKTLVTSKEFSDRANQNLKLGIEAGVSLDVAKMIGFLIGQTAVDGDIEKLKEFLADSVDLIFDAMGAK